MMLSKPSNGVYRRNFCAMIDAFADQPEASRIIRRCCVDTINSVSVLGKYYSKEGPSEPFRGPVKAIHRFVSAPGGEPCR